MEISKLLFLLLFFLNNFSNELTDKPHLSFFKKYSSHPLSSVSISIIGKDKIQFLYSPILLSSISNTLSDFNIVVISSIFFSISIFGNGK